MFPHNFVKQKKGPGLVTQVLLQCVLLTWQTTTLNFFVQLY